MNEVHTYEYNYEHQEEYVTYTKPKRQRIRISDMMYLCSYTLLLLSLANMIYGDIDLFKVCLFGSVFAKVMYALVKNSIIDRIYIKKRR